MTDKQALKLQRYRHQRGEVRMDKQSYEKGIKQLNDRLIPAFHEHLDECAQCRNHPFDLCGVGATLLRLAATGIHPIEESQNE